LSPVSAQCTPGRPPLARRRPRWRHRCVSKVAFPDKPLTLCDVTPLACVPWAWGQLCNQVGTRNADHQLGSSVPWQRVASAPPCRQPCRLCIRTLCAPVQNHEPPAAHPLRRRAAPPACWRGPGTRTVDSPHQNLAATAVQHHCHDGTADVCVAALRLAWLPLSREMLCRKATAFK